MAPPGHSAGPRTGSPWAAPAVVGVAVLGLVCVAAAAVGGPWTFTQRLPLWEQDPVDLRPIERAPANNLPPWPALTGDGDPSGRIATVTLWVLILLAAAAVAYVVWRRWPRRRIRPVEEESARPPVQTSVDLDRLRTGALEAIDLLDRIADPKDAVIRSWLALELAAERSGVPRDPAATPSEFTAAVLRSTDAGSGAVERLLALYHRARFSTSGVGIEEVRAARACVLELSRTWRGYDDALRASVPGTSP